MTVLAAVMSWGIALVAHALLQSKFCRVLALPCLPSLPLVACRLAFPAVALYLCLKLGFACGVLTWFGTASVAGILASLGITSVATHRMRGRDLRDLPTGAA